MSSVRTCWFTDNVYLKMDDLRMLNISWHHVTCIFHTSPVFPPVTCIFMFHLYFHISPVFLHVTCISTYYLYFHMLPVFPHLTCISTCHLYCHTSPVFCPQALRVPLVPRARQEPQVEKGDRESADTPGTQGKGGQRAPQVQRGHEVTPGLQVSHNTQWLSTFTGCMLFNPGFQKQQTNNLFILK